MAHRAPPSRLPPPPRRPPPGGPDTVDVDHRLVLLGITFLLLLVMSAVLCTLTISPLQQILRLVLSIYDLLIEPIFGIDLSDILGADGELARLIADVPGCILGPITTICCGMICTLPLLFLWLLFSILTDGQRGCDEPLPPSWL